MCLSPSVPDAPAPPPEQPNYEGVKSKRKDERRRQLAATGRRDTILAGANSGNANTAKTVLGQ